MAAKEKWYFTKEQLDNTPSRKCGFDADKELSYRQQAANFIQDMGQRLLVTQLCINTAIVYMHRFYVYHSFTNFHRNAIAAASLFLAAKIEEQPRRLEHVIKAANSCLHREQLLDTKSAAYLEQAQDLVFNEDVLLQTLGFEVAIDHPHSHVVRCCDLFGASKELARASYFMASNSLHLTTMCLQYKPTVVACFCIHLACKSTSWSIPEFKDGKEWYSYVDKTVTLSQLEQLTEEYLVRYDKCPAKLKSRIKSIGSTDASENQNKEQGPENPLMKRRRTKSGSEQIDSSENRNLSSNIPSTSKIASSTSTKTVKAIEYPVERSILHKPSSSSIPPSYPKKSSSTMQQIPLPSAKMNDIHHQRKQNVRNTANSPESTTATKRYKFDNSEKKN